MSKIDDISLSMTFELYFDLTWNESRLLINESAPEWETDGSVMGSTNYVKSLWLPDIQIYNIKQFQTRAIVTDVAGLIIFKNKNILYTVSTEAVISCPMKFSAYPLDHQVSFVFTELEQNLAAFSQSSLAVEKTSQTVALNKRGCSNCLLAPSHYHPFEMHPKTVCVNFTKRNAPKLFRNCLLLQQNIWAIHDQNSCKMTGKLAIITRGPLMNLLTVYRPLFCRNVFCLSSLFPRA